MRACWDTMVLAPPFCITKDEIDELVRLARIALDKTYADVKSEMDKSFQSTSPSCILFAKYDLVSNPTSTEEDSDDPIFQFAHEPPRRPERGGLGLAMGVTLPCPTARPMTAEEKNSMNLRTAGIPILATTRWPNSRRPRVLTAKIDIYGSNDELFAKLKAGNPGYDVIIPSANWIQRWSMANMLMPARSRQDPQHQELRQVVHGRRV